MMIVNVNLFIVKNASINTGVMVIIMPRFDYCHYWLKHLLNHWHEMNHKAKLAYLKTLLEELNK